MTQNEETVSMIDSTTLSVLMKPMPKMTASEWRAADRKANEEMRAILGTRTPKLSETEKIVVTKIIDKLKNQKEFDLGQYSDDED